MKIISICLFFLFSINIFGANLEWLEEVANKEKITVKSEEKKIHLRVIVGGDWGPEECYYEIISNISPHKLFLSSELHPIEEKITLVRVTSDKKEEREISSVYLAFLIELITQNDYFNLPEHAEIGNMTVMCPKSPFSIISYVKLENKSNLIARDNFHLVSYQIYQDLANAWTNKTEKLTL